MVDTAGGSTVTAASDEETKDSNYEGFEEENESDASRSGPLNAINGYRLRPTTTKVLSTEEIKIKEKKDAGISLARTCTLSMTYSFTHSLLHSLLHLLTRLLTYSLTHSLTH